MKQYEIFRLSYDAMEPEENSSKSVVNLSAEFCCNGVCQKVDGFYAGNGKYEIRFLPRKPGMVTWKVTGIVHEEGGEECIPSDGSRHGLIKTEGTALKYEDGTDFYSLGTTVYAMLHQPAALIEETKKTLKASPFNKVRTCVFPKHYLFNNNEPELFAFERTPEGKFDFNSPCFEFWDRLDDCITELGDARTEIDLIVFHPYDCWGFSKMTKAEYMPYLHYLTARLSAHPNIWWSLANEYDAMKSFTRDDWNLIGETLHQKDAYGHMLSCHYMLEPFDYGKDYVTHCSVQGDVTGVENLINEFNKPVLMDEFGYEGNIHCHWGHLSGFEMVHRFWTCCVMGGYGTHGETFLEENDTLWWAKGGRLRGDSPARLAFLKEIMEELPGHLTPVSFSTVDVDKLRRCRLNPTSEEAQALNDFEIALVKLSEDKMEQWIKNMNKDVRIYTGHIEDKAYLSYYGRHCTAQAELELSEDKEYRVEIIDVWNMTREVVSETARGKFKLTLPGKEGTAVLAVAKAEI